MILNNKEYSKLITKAVRLLNQNLTTLEILEEFNIFENSFLVPEDFHILFFLFPQKMKKIINGCKPSYLPNFINVNGCDTRKEWCNLHDFCYWISWPRKASDLIFINGMNRDLKGFKNKTHNYSFYIAVRTFGQTAFSEENKTIIDFLEL